MATVYVCKDGSDSNNGSTWALAKLTIQGGLNVASTGDTVRVGPGVYNEQLLMRKTGTFVLTLQGDGYVILDPSPQGGAYQIAIDFSASTSGTWTINDIIVQTCTHAVHLTMTGSDAASNTFNFNRCTFRNHSLVFPYVYDYTRVLNVADCVFVGGTYALQDYGGTHLSALFEWCTFDNIAQTIARNAAYTSLTVKHCIFTKNGSHFFIPTTTGSIVLDYNCTWYDGTSVSRWASTNYSTLATWKAASSQDTNSVSEDPVYVDRVKRALSLYSTSPIYADIDEGGVKGAGYRQGKKSTGMSKNDPGGNWANRILSNTQVNASDNIELKDSTNGYGRTPVINLGSIKDIGCINIITNITVAMYPANVPDYSTSDTQPKRMKIRWRGSYSSFADGDSTPAWSEIEPSAIGQDVNYLAQYVQVEATLRDNGS